MAFGKWKMSITHPYNEYPIQEGTPAQWGFRQLYVTWLTLVFIIILIYSSLYSISITTCIILSTSYCVTSLPNKLLSFFDFHSDSAEIDVLRYMYYYDAFRYIMGSCTRGCTIASGNHQPLVTISRTAQLVWVQPSLSDINVRHQTFIVAGQSWHTFVIRKFISVIVGQSTWSTPWYCWNQREGGARWTIYDFTSSHKDCSLLF